MKERKFSYKKLRFGRCLGTLLLIIFLVSVVSGRFTVKAYAEEPIQLQEVVVEANDSLWSLAEEYCPDSKDIRQTIREIKSINNLSGPEIYVGQILLLPN